MVRSGHEFELMTKEKCDFVPSSGFLRLPKFANLS